MLLFKGKPREGKKVEQNNKYNTSAIQKGKEKNNKNGSHWGREQKIMGWNVLRLKIRKGDYFPECCPTKGNTSFRRAYFVVCAQKNQNILLYFNK